MYPGSIKSRYYHPFTLIELLTVIAILTALISLLLPALVHTREKARIAFCQNNQRQIYTALTLYEQDVQVLPYSSKYYIDWWGDGSSKGIAYDDLLGYGSYDGRPSLSWTQVCEWEIPASFQNAIYRCPSAPGYNGFHSTRHYALNGQICQKNWDMDPHLYPPCIGFPQINLPEQTILITEHQLILPYQAYASQVLGNIHGADCKMQHQVPWRNGMVWHRQCYANYIMVDGHGEFLNAYDHEIINGGIPQEHIPGGLWKLK